MVGQGPQRLEHTRLEHVVVVCARIASDVAEQSDESRHSIMLEQATYSVVP